MTALHKLQKAIEYSKKHDLPVNINRAINNIKIVYPNFYEKHKGIIDSKCWPVSARKAHSPAYKKCFYARMKFFYGIPYCKHCGSSNGPMFTRPPTYALTGWYTYCSDSCSKSSAQTLAKRTKTNQKRYGVDNVFQSEIIKYKLKQTNLERYGFENPNQNNKVKRKTKRTLKRNYGNMKNYFKQRNAKSIMTNRKKLGCDWPTQNKKVRRKVIKSLMKSYGVANPSHSPEIIYKILNSFKNRKSIKIDGTRYTGLQGYEPQALKYLNKKGAKVCNPVSVKTVEPFKYTFKDKDRYYFPDFKIKLNGKIWFVEVKSIYTSGLQGNHGDGKTSFKILRAKANAVVNSGKRFMLIIWDKKGVVTNKGLPNKSQLKSKLLQAGLLNS